MTPVQVSVVIPALNEAERIGGLIRFLQKNADERLLEIIVADGGSSDQTRNLAVQSGAKVITVQPAGRARQMNEGALQARGNILYFIHADTQPPAHFLNAIENALSQGVDMGCFRYRFDSPNRLLGANAWFTRFHFLFCQGGDKTFFIPADLFKKMGGYNEYFVVMEEYDFLQRAFRAGLRFRVLPDPALVSARKYEGRSWLRVQIANLVVFNLWRWKLASPATLKRVYQRLLSKG